MPLKIKKLYQTFFRYDDMIRNATMDFFFFFFFVFDSQINEIVSKKIVNYRY